MKICKHPKILALSCLTFFTIGCTTGGGSPSGFSSNPATNTAVAPPPIAGDQGAQDFLARSGFLGFASINDRAIGQNRFLAYHSRADVLPEDKNGIDDIYLKDTKLGTTIIVSKATDGTQGNAASTQASISADGRFVVYRSAASNLVAGDSNGTEDIFMYNVHTGVTSRVSVGAGAAQSNGTSLTPAVSNGGQYVVFASEATNLVATDTNAQPDVFVRDTVGNTTNLISSNSALLDSANGASFDPAITPDGAFIALSTESTNITATALNGTRQVVRIERAIPANRVLVSQTGGTQANGPCYEPSVSNDGNIIAFFTNASNLGTDTNTFFDVYVRNISGTSTTRASLDSGGGESDGHSGFPSISGDGAIVSFGSLATDLVAGDTNSVFDVFSRTGGTTTRVSVGTAGTQANVDSDLPAVSLDGRYVAFRSAASNLDGNDTTFDDDIFMRDLTTPSTVLHSIACRIPAVFAGFGAAMNSSTGNSPTELTSGDFNADGNIDLAVSKQITGNTVAILLGTGTGSFGAPIDSPVLNSPAALASGDFDLDGHLDVAVCEVSASSVSILLGDGTGSLTGPSSFATQSFPRAVVAADLNGDLQTDLVVANAGSDSVSVLLNTGFATFAAAANFSVGVSPRSVVLGDFDGDNNLDLATANFTGDNVSVLLGDGAGNFGTATNFPAGNGAASLKCHDFNGDGNLDLAVANSLDNTVSLLLGNGAGSFGSPVNTAVGSGPFFMTSGDFDGDCNFDLATANNSGGNASVILGDGAGNFGPVNTVAIGSNPASIEANYFDGDGQLDLAAVVVPNLVSVVLNQRPDWAGLGSGTTLSTGNGPRNSAFGDLDGDGDLDLVVANTAAGTVSVRFNNGSGTFTGSDIALTAANNLYTVRLEDFNNDGSLDILLPSGGSDTNHRLLVNDGSGNFTTTTFPKGASTARLVSVADLNNDGFQDFVCSGGSDNYVLLNNTVGGFNITTISNADSTVGLTLGDFDGDGDVDLARGRGGAFFSTHIRIRLNDGAGNFGPETVSGFPFARDELVAGDLDGDGDVDVVSSLTPDDQVAVALNEGTGTFATDTLYPVGDLPEQPELGDIDGDGDLDIIVTNRISNDFSVLLGDGNGRFAPVRHFTVGNSPHGLSLGDIDGDGDLDVGCPNELDNNISIFLNQACP